MLLVFIWATGFGLGTDNHSGPLHLKVVIFIYVNPEHFKLKIFKILQFPNFNLN